MSSASYHAKSRFRLAPQLVEAPSVRRPEAVRVYKLPSTMDPRAIYYSKRNEKRSINDRFHAQSMIHLESLDGHPSLLTEEPVDCPLIVMTFAQRNLNRFDSASVKKKGWSL